MVQPSFRRPTMLPAGAFTSSKKVSQKGDEPLMSWIGLVLTPSLSILNRMKLMPWCLGASKSVRTRQKIQSALSA